MLKEVLSKLPETNSSKQISEVRSNLYILSNLFSLKFYDSFWHFNLLCTDILLKFDINYRVM